MPPLGAKGGKLLKKGGKLVRGCNCCQGVDCNPGEQPLACAEGGRTGTGTDQQIPPFPMDPNARGLVKITFTVAAGSAELAIVIGGVTNIVRVLQPGVTTITLCKPIGVADIVFGVQGTSQVPAQWAISFSCLPKCCNVVPQPNIKAASPNPLP